MFWSFVGLLWTKSAFYQILALVLLFKVLFSSLQGPVLLWETALFPTRPGMRRQDIVWMLVVVVGFESITSSSGLRTNKQYARTRIIRMGLNMRVKLNLLVQGMFVTLYVFVVLWDLQQGSIMGCCQHCRQSSQSISLFSIQRRLNCCWFNLSLN